MIKVLYPGTFNPIHNGHADLVERATRLFDRVVLGIATSPQKSPSELNLRVELAEQALAHLDRVEVCGFNKGDRGVCHSEGHQDSNRFRL